MRETKLLRSISTHEDACSLRDHENEVQQLNYTVIDGESLWISLSLPGWLSHLTSLWWLRLSHKLNLCCVIWNASDLFQSIILLVTAEMSHKSSNYCKNSRRTNTHYFNDSNSFPFEALSGSGGQLCQVKHGKLPAVTTPCDKRAAESSFLLITYTYFRNTDKLYNCYFHTI